MRLRAAPGLWIALAVWLIACAPAPGPDREESARAGERAAAAMARYLEAQAQRDGARMNAFYLEGPEFEAAMNGERQDWSTTVASNLAYYASLRDIQGGFDQLRTTVLGSDAVVISGRRDQTMTDTAGVSLRHTGAASWIWVQRDGKWRLVHIASHFARDAVP